MDDKAERFYKLAKPDGFDFYTGNTINYRKAAQATGKDELVRPPEANEKLGLCSEGLIHASRKPNQCFIGASIPCSAYLVSGIPVAEDSDKCGFLSLGVIEEISNLDELFGWHYSLAMNPANPFHIKSEMKPEYKAMLRDWDSVWASVGDSVGASVGASVWASVWASVRASVGDSVGASVWASVGASVGASVWASVWASVRASVWASVWASVRASVWAYTGRIFAPAVDKWKYIEHEQGEYPYKICVNLWEAGFVPSFDGKVWRLHAGEKADIVYEWTP